MCAAGIDIADAETVAAGIVAQGSEAFAASIDLADEVCWYLDSAIDRLLI